MTPDHEAAKRYAAYIGDMARDHVCGQDDVNLSAAYLDAMAQRDEALALLEEIEIPLARCDGELSAIYHRGTVERDNCKAFSERARELGVKLTSFLAKHRKTGASDGK